MNRLRVVVATPVEERLTVSLAARLPDVEMIHEPSLLPPSRWPGDFAGEPAFRRSPAQQERFERLLSSADVLFGIPDLDPASLARTVRTNPRLAWVQVMAAGGAAQVREAGLVRAELDRVAFTTGAGVHTGPLSEFALFGLLAGAKNLPRLRADQERREWPGRWAMGQLCDQRIVVVGLGHLGRAVAAAVGAMGGKVTGVNRSQGTWPGVEAVLPLEALRDAATDAHALVNTLPESAQTRHLVSAEVLASMAPGATIVSIGRGSVIDETALAAAAGRGDIGFAALDVFEVEPLPRTSPLWDLPNVLVSPHTAASSPHEERLLVDLFGDNLDRFLAGGALRNRIDVESLLENGASGSSAV